MGINWAADGGGIVSSSAGARQTVIGIINASWSYGKSVASTLGTSIDAIESWLPQTTPADILPPAAPVAPPTVVEPAVDIPSSANASDVMTMFDTKYLELVAMLASKFTQFRADYFPDDSAAYSLVEDWLQDAMNNPSKGLPEAVADQILTDARDKITADASRASDAVLQTFAARRFPLPPGAAAAAITQIQTTAQNNIAEAGRKITSASIEQVKFAVEKMISLRQLAMSSAVEYIKALASGPDMASRLVGVGYDAQSKLISAASQFYGVRADVAKLTAQTDQFNVTTNMQAAEKNQAKDLALLDARLKALLTECQAMSQMATSLFNNLHASAGVDDKYSESYNYQGELAGPIYRVS